MKRLFDFIKSNKYAFFWTISYCLIMWIVLLGLFNFNIFSGIDWVKLAHARLQGFPGFVFGILILAAVPMYIATTLIIIRTKKPLFSLSLPNFLKPVSEEKKETPEIKNIEQESKTGPVLPLLPENLPSELRTPFLRAKENLSALPKSNFILMNRTNYSNDANIDDNTKKTESISPSYKDLPLPEDFDFSDENFEEQDFTSIPTFNPIFTDINLEKESSDKEASQPKSEVTKEVLKYFQEKGQKPKIEDDIIITDNFAIATHEDSDFWIADDETWFAAGKHKPSPIKKLLEKATKNKTPVLYLLKDNIMDLNLCLNKWEKSGIKTIQKISDLDNL